MSRLPASNELSTYYVPKPIYDQVMDNLQKKSEASQKGPNLVKFNCHKKRYRYLNTDDPALSHPNIMEAVRQAFEDRNFRILYKLIYKGLDKRDFFVSNQLFEYLYAAIEIDPKITNRHEMLVNAVKGFKALNNDEEAEEFIKKAHLLIKKQNNEEESFGITDDEIKEEPDSDEE